MDGKDAMMSKKPALLYRIGNKKVIENLMMIPVLISTSNQDASVSTNHGTFEDVACQMCSNGSYIHIITKKAMCTQFGNKK